MCYRNSHNLLVVLQFIRCMFQRKTIICYCSSHNPHVVFQFIRCMFQCKVLILVKRCIEEVISIPPILMCYRNSSLFFSSLDAYCNAKPSCVTAIVTTCSLFFSSVDAYFNARTLTHTAIVTTSLLFFSSSSDAFLNNASITPCSKRMTIRVLVVVFVVVVVVCYTNEIEI